MFHSWLDRWDEHRALRGEHGKKLDTFALDAERAFLGATKVVNIEEFCALADRAVADASFFDAPNESHQDFQKRDGWLRFSSEMSTDVDENNVVCAKITESGSLDHALVVFHHWNARARNDHIAKFFSQRGTTVIEIAMSYHFERSRPGSTHADYMLSPNLGRTIQSIRQSVWDGRKLIRWLKSEGYKEVSVLGMSLGSWVAGLVAAHDPAVSKASLFLTAGSLADMVWSGRATRFIRESLEPNIDLSDLRRAWSPLNLENFARRLARPDLDLQIVLAKRDKVVPPNSSDSFIETLEQYGKRISTFRLNCGHYSLSMPPYIVFAGFYLKRFLFAANNMTVN